MVKVLHSIGDWLVDVTSKLFVPIMLHPGQAALIVLADYRLINSYSLVIFRCHNRFKV